jgi:hypothetical protein
MAGIWCQDIHLFEVRKKANRETRWPVVDHRYLCSGSISAQKLLYGHSDHGDLLSFISGHFDTTSGHKQESASYTNIHKTISNDIPIVRDDRSKLLFLTDVVKGVIFYVALFWEVDANFELTRRGGSSSFCGTVCGGSGTAG